MEDSHIHPNRVSVSAVYKSLLVTRVVGRENAERTGTAEPGGICI